MANGTVSSSIAVNPLRASPSARPDPLDEIVGVRRPVPLEVAASEAGQCLVVVQLGGWPDPRRRVDERLVAIDHRATHEVTRDAGRGHTWTNACPAVGTRALLSRSPSCARVCGLAHRTRVGHDLDAEIGLRVAHALLTEAGRVRRAQSGIRQRVEPPVVGGRGTEVERAPVQPSDDEAPINGERTVDVRRRQPGRSRPHRGRAPTPVLTLDGEDAPHDVERGPSPRCCCKPCDPRRAARRRSTAALTDTDLPVYTCRSRGQAGRVTAAVFVNEARLEVAADEDLRRPGAS